MIIATVAVFAPLRQTYDYLYQQDPDQPALGPGVRVWVPFGRSQRVAVVTSVRNAQNDERTDLKPIADVLDNEPLLPPEMLELAKWSARYYHHPLGDVIAAMLPTWLRRKRDIPRPTRAAWRVTEAGRVALRDGSARGERQAALLAQLRMLEVATVETFAGLEFGWRAVIKRLVQRDWVESLQLAPTSRVPVPEPIAGFVLNAEQVIAAELIRKHMAHFQAIVVHGVTGSGKTEVYLDAIAHALAAGRQALVLVPEIALTEALVARFRVRFGTQVAVLHSALNERERVVTWDACRRGEAAILIGTRSAVWVGLPRLGVIIVDEEHDGSYKQHDGLRYSGRDMAIVRAKRADIPIVLGSATPALETLTNIERGRFLTTRLDKRAKSAQMPSIKCVDVRGLRLEGGLGHVLLATMSEHLARGEQVMLFLNRRGYAPLLMCRACGELRRCDRCDAYLVYHKHLRAACCHQCDKRWPMSRPVLCCEDEEVTPLGLGTERLEETVAELFPEQRICRIDRDTVRRQGAFDAMLADVASHKVDILIGTQMVAKGLDFADVTLVGIVDADSRLYSVDFRAEERLAQLVIQVAGRAGRAHKPGRVLIQTHHPDHPVLRRIIEQGYEAYAQVALEERRDASLPPFTAMVIVRAESPDAQRPIDFLTQVRQLLNGADNGAVDISYPIPALMERRAGRYRALIVMRSADRSYLGRLLAGQVTNIEKLAQDIRLRWSLDVDPQDTL
jgi:primosomal protein N' (replication factor Y)